MKRGDIFRTMRPHGVTCYSVYRTVNLFDDTGGIIDLRNPVVSKRPKTAPEAEILIGGVEYLDAIHLSHS